MKYLIIILCALFAANPSILIGQKINRNWKIIDTRPRYDPQTKYSLYRDIKCADSMNSMIWVGMGYREGYYFRGTTDGGKSWRNLYADTGYWATPDHYRFVADINWIDYPNPDLFIAVGDSGVVLRTTDKGENWYKYIYDPNLNFRHLHMLDENYGMMVGCPESCDKPSDLVYLRTTDGGLTWNRMSSPSLFCIEHIELISKDLFYDLGCVMDSNPRGMFIRVHGDFDSFDTIPRPTYGTFMHFVNEREGWLGGGNKLLDSMGWVLWSQIIYHTSDGGFNWEIQLDTVTNGAPIKDIRFRDEKFGIASSHSGLILVTRDGGKNWNAELIDSFPHDDGSAHTIFSMQYPTPKTVFTIEDFDFIYKYTDDESGSAEELPVKNESILLFPNPVSGKLRVSDIPSPYPLRIITPEDITVLDMANPLNSLGNYEIDVGWLPAGIYFVKLGSKVEKFVKY